MKERITEEKLQLMYEDLCARDKIIVFLLTPLIVVFAIVAFLHGFIQQIIVEIKK